jgi:outer membrane lipoprotein-sorting protein
MKRLFFALMLLASQMTFTQAQTAKQVLDKCAAVVSAKNGVSAHFTMTSAQYGNASGDIAVKGRMFRASTNVAKMWFDGKTLWTYMNKNEEVNVTTPTEAQLQVLNPYNFINMYKTGFTYTMTKANGSYRVHLTAKDAKRRVQEMFITIDQKSYHPTEVKLLQKSKWTTFNISNLKKDKLADAQFRFNAKDFPSAEVIDLR